MGEGMRTGDGERDLGRFRSGMVAGTVSAVTSPAASLPLSFLIMSMTTLKAGSIHSSGSWLGIIARL